MKIVRILRDDERIIKGLDVKPGMVISPDTESRNPDNIFLVTEVKGGVIHGCYLGDSSKRNREPQSVVGCAHFVLLFPLATMAVHGL